MSDDRYILERKSFVDTKTNQCLNFGIKDLARVTITLNNMDMWLNQAEERIAELEEQLENATKQVRKEVCKEIKSEIIKHHEWKYEDCYTNSDVIECILDVIEENLDRIQGE